MTTIGEILPCPLCGRAPLTCKHFSSYQVHCTQDDPQHSFIVTARTQAEAITAWNTRIEALSHPTDRMSLEDAYREGFADGYSIGIGGWPPEPRLVDDNWENSDSCASVEATRDRMRYALGAFTTNAVMDEHTHRVSVDEWVLSEARAALASHSDVSG